VFEQEHQKIAWLRKPPTPEDLIKYRMGHSQKFITDEPSELSEELHCRLEQAEKVRAGFPIPTTMKPMVPRNRKLNRLLRNSKTLCGLDGGADETRTRDLLRDRQAF
jgi:hypothetical protein